MDKQYQYQALTRLDSGGYPGEEYGTIPTVASPTITNAVTGSQTYQYYYRDSASLSNANSSQVLITVEDSWTASVDSSNQLTITVTTTLVDMGRGNINGSPASGGSAYRNIYIRRTPNGSNLLSFLNDDIRVAHNISGTQSLGTYTFTLAPGDNLTQSSLYVLNTVPGHENDPLPNIYSDALNIGTSFTNILPADYRPGMTWNGSAYMSHNRNGGTCNYWNGVAWTEMRTQDYSTGKGNPPLLYRDEDWYNQALIGQE